MSFKSSRHRVRVSALNSNSDVRGNLSLNPERTREIFLSLQNFSMLARQTLTRAAIQPSLLGAAPANARNMATLREIELRLKSVRNIEKITKVSS
jgi:hypothetical protein